MADVDRFARSVGTALSRFREDVGISRETLQAKSGVHRNTIASYENGKAIPTLKTLVVLADTLGYELRVSFAKKKEVTPDE